VNYFLKKKSNVVFTFESQIFEFNFKRESTVIQITMKLPFAFY